MSNVKVSYEENDDLVIEFPEGMTDEHGNIYIEEIEAELRDWGIIEVNEINPNEGKEFGLWLDAGNQNVYKWDREFTESLRANHKGVLKPQGKLKDYINVDVKEHQEFLVWYFGDPLSDAIKELRE